MLSQSLSEKLHGDIRTFAVCLDGEFALIKKLRTERLPPELQVLPALLTAFCYVRAYVLLESAIKNTVLNLRKSQGMSDDQEETLLKRLETFNNADYQSTCELFETELKCDLSATLGPFFGEAKFQSVVRNIVQVVEYRHKCAHGSADIPTALFRSRTKTPEHFENEVPELIEFVSALGKLTWDSARSSIIISSQDPVSPAPECEDAEEQIVAEVIPDEVG